MCVCVSLVKLECLVSFLFFDIRALPLINLNICRQIIAIVFVVVAAAAPINDNHNDSFCSSKWF